MTMRVLDTAALIHWPLERLHGAVVPNQRDEFVRIAPDREITLEVADLDWRTPSPDYLEQASSVANSTGDLAGLSKTDLEILALTLQLGATLVTDDYRLQNCCVAAGIGHEPVLTAGIAEEWEWQLICTGCRAIGGESEISVKKGEYGNCPDCGSPYRMRKA